MRLTWLHLAVSIILFSGVRVSGETHAVLPRQDGSPSPSPSSSVASTAPTASATTSTSSRDTAQSSNGGSSISASAGSAPSIAPTSTSQQPKTTLSTSASNSNPSPTSGTVSVVSAIPTATIISPVPANDTAKGDPQALPIPPRITPALSVAGAILMTTGIFYTLLGIKTKWLHVFLSAAYLTSLGVTILIVYVINPPISDAKQGAYLAAAVVTGVVFGGGSVVFPDVAEGLGCFLGGFCFSMWFMVLRPGGLITSTAGKAIFISGFTVAGFALYISHYTRTYGIIGCASFAGATAIVLGIDCFSQAGLKEFWLYIWNLNNALLPPHYNYPYPITRGIRVEIAGMILICAVGIMSQMKVWAIIKKRREDRAAAKNLERQRQDAAEEELGRNLEENNERERITWEAVYGGNGQKRGQPIDSGVGTDEPCSIRKGSTSVRTVEMPRSGEASIEMNRLRPIQGSSAQIPQEGKEDGRVTIHVASDDEIFALPPIDFGEFRDSLDWKGEAPKASKALSISKSSPEEPPEEPLKEQVTDVSVPAAGEAAQRSFEIPAEEALKPDMVEVVERSGGPQIISLPFRIPDANMENDNDGSSVATFAASDRRFSRMSKRTSGASLVKSPSKQSQRQSWAASNASEEALMIPHVDDDRASSLAATIDGVSDRGSGGDDDDSRSRRASELIDGYNETSPDRLMPTTDFEGDWFQSNGPDNADTAEGKSNSWAGGAPSMSSVPLLELPKQNQKRDERDLSESPSRELTSAEEPLMNEHTKSAAESNALGKRPMRTLSGRLPDDASKVIMAYRTNEWAKHLEQAELPKLDELNEPNSAPAGPVAAKEAAAPVLVEELQQTPLTAEPPPVVNTTKMGARERLSRAALNRLHLSKNPSPYQKPPQPPKDTNRRSDSGPRVPPPLVQQQSSESLQSQDQPPLQPGQSQLSLTTARNYRSSSTPLTSQPFAESPIEEDVETSFPPRFTPSPMHLMSKRDKLVRNRPSSTSLLKLTATPNPTPPPHSSASDSSSLLGGAGEMDNDNIPLSHRKSLLRAQRSSLPHRSSSTPLQYQAPNANTNNPRDSTIAAWRNTLSPSPTTHAHLNLHRDQSQDVSLEKRREELLREKRRASANAAVNEQAKGRRESVLERGMRRGDMLEAHRDAMRRMQAGANRKL